MILDTFLVPMLLTIAIFLTLESNPESAKVLHGLGGNLAFAIVFFGSKWFLHWLCTTEPPQLVTKYCPSEPFDVSIGTAAAAMFVVKFIFDPSWNSFIAILYHATIAVIMYYGVKYMLDWLYPFDPKTAQVHKRSKPV